jgi:hypothetical protein
MLFLLLFATWVVYPRLAPQLPFDLSPAAARRCGYLAAAALALPYLHVAFRRALRHRRALRVIGPVRIPLLGQAVWLRAHLVAAWLACLIALVHCRGRAGTWLTWGILCLFWAVMLSGVAGYWGQRLVYRILDFTVTPEYGRARLRTKERLLLWRRAQRLLTEYWKFTEYDVRDWAVLCRKVLEPTSLLNRALWDKLTGTGAVFFDAVRVIRQGALLGMDDLSAGQMNPVVGALNQIIHDKKCDLLEELQENDQALT